MTNGKTLSNQNVSLCGEEILISGIPFRIGEKIHQGSDSRVFSASSTKGGGDSAFVVKCYCCRRDDEVWHNAMREIDAGNMLKKCRHVVRLLGYSAVTDSSGTRYKIFLLFNRLECLDEMTVDVPTALEMCRDISLALKEVSRKGLVHGDVKPSNIFFDGKKWLLGDFGSVTVKGQPHEYATEGYASPEAVTGEACDVRSDIYSLGITLYKTLSGGRLPFCELPCEEAEESDALEAIGRRLRGEAVPPIEGVSGEVNELLMRLCAFIPGRRFRSPSAAARAVAAILGTR